MLLEEIPMKKMLLLAAMGFGTMAMGQDARPIGAPPPMGVPGAGLPGRDSTNKVSSVRMFLWNLGNDRQILFGSAGSVPVVYRILGLSEEQMKALEQ